jgi:hypothetical protein
MAHYGDFKGQLQHFLDGDQGKNLENGGHYNGGIPPQRAGATRENDLHASGQDVAGPHNHRNKGINANTDPKTFNYQSNKKALGFEATNLDQSHWNKKNQYSVEGAREIDKVAQGKF